MSSAAINLHRAEAARKVFLAALSKARHDFELELTTDCGVGESEIDSKSFTDAVSDGAADMMSSAFDRLEREAREEECSAALRDDLADRADYHSRVA